MLDNGFPAGGISRSSQAYIGSFQHAIALDAERSRDAKQFEQDADRLVYEAQLAIERAYSDGLSQGYENGWSTAADEANKQMQTQLAYTKQYLRDKERLQAALEQQALVIDALEKRVTELEEENSRLRAENSIEKASDARMHELISSLRLANQGLQEQVQDLEALYKARTQEYSAQLWQYNRAMVFLNTVGSVLGELTKDNTPSAIHARALFAEKYAKEVDRGLETGTIKRPPEEDPEFKSFLPKTQELISGLLAMAREDQEQTPSADPGQPG